MTLLDDYDALLLDLDGVVYRGRAAVPHAVEVLGAAVDAGVRCGFVTNNASRPPSEVAEHLTSLGVQCDAAQVITSAQVGADLLAEQVPAGSTVLAVGGPGVELALSQRGFAPVRVQAERERGRTDIEIAQSVHGVLQGFGPDITWRDLAVASYAVAAGAFWVATNLDRTIPRADGLAPGNGMLVAAVTAATGATPPSAGKPAADMMRIAASRLGARRPLAVGDRLDTDIRGAAAAGIDSLVVMTGVTGPAELLAAATGDRPTYVSDDMRGLLRALPRLDADLPERGVGATDRAIATSLRQHWGGEDTDEAAVQAQIRSLLGGAAGK